MESADKTFDIVFKCIKMGSTVKIDIKNVRLAVEKHLKELGINGLIRIASAKFSNGY
ncbi:hypothetical protein [Ferroplasma sp.]|jgi:hypothetical protein|uniref:hypothetical protein n=1 Tax=Ferroplasma sp. TaxID=2591003 RepID=UPI002625AC4F|nr:hypothetical protein [Ferroplasma sp.]